MAMMMSRDEPMMMSMAMMMMSHDDQVRLMTEVMKLEHQLAPAACSAGLLPEVGSRLITSSPHHLISSSFQ